jgi:putative hydrolase of the HAD superfamily
MLSTKYRLFLLSNTDAIHIETFEQKNGATFIVIFTTALKSLFLLWIGMRKPNSEIYNTFWMNMICKQNAHYSLMIKENTDAALY